MASFRNQKPMKKRFARATLKIEAWNKEKKKYENWFFSINPYKPQEPKGLPLGLRPIWLISEEKLRKIVSGEIEKYDEQSSSESETAQQDIEKNAGNTP